MVIIYCNIYNKDLDKSESQDELCLSELVDEPKSFFKVSSDLTEVCESFLVEVATAFLHPCASISLFSQQLHRPVVFDPYAPQW